MNITRREAIRISASTLAGMTLGVPEKLQAQSAQQQAPWPLPLNADGSAPEHPESAAGPITDPLMWRTPDRQTPPVEFDYKKMKVKVDTRGLGKLAGTMHFSDLEKLPSLSHAYLLQCGAANPRGVVKWTGVKFS